MTQLVATCLAVYGVFMEPIGWKLAGLVWGYALVWFLVNEAVKRGSYRLLAHHTRIARSHVERIHEPLQPGGSVGGGRTEY